MIYNNKTYMYKHKQKNLKPNFKLNSNHRLMFQGTRERCIYTYNYPQNSFPTHEKKKYIYRIFFCVQEN